MHKTDRRHDRRNMPRMPTKTIKPSIYCLPSPLTARIPAPTITTVDGRYSPADNHTYQLHARTPPKLKPNSPFFLLTVDDVQGNYFETIGPGATVAAF